MVKLSSLPIADEADGTEYVPVVQDGVTKRMAVQVISEAATHPTPAEIQSAVVDAFQAGEVTKANVGLGNVDNTSDANKPVSTAQQAALNNKADASALNAKADAAATTAALANKEPKIAAGDATQYWRGDKSWQTLNRGAVGLGSVDNTSDVDKPVSNATAAAIAAVGTNTHEKLTGDRNYYVRPDGSNNNTGLASTAAAAFQTLQFAVDYVRSHLDFNGHNVVINVADGTYAGGVTIFGPHVGQGDLYIIGNQVTPDNCNIAVTADGANCFAVHDGAKLITRGFDTSATGAGGICYLADTGGQINMGACEFGATNGSHIEAGSFGVITAYGAPHNIKGGATSHFHVGSDGEINVGTFQATITGNPPFTAYFAGIRSGRLDVRNFTWTGTVNAQSYVCHQRGVIDGHAGLPAPLPGTPGRTATGGIVTGSVTFPVDITADGLPAAQMRIGAWNTSTGAFTPLAVFQSNPTPTLSLTASGPNVFDGIGGQSTFSGPSVVVANSGASNTSSGGGLSFYNFNSGRCFDAQQPFGPIGYLQRRGNDGAVLVWVDNQGDQVGSVSINSAGNSASYNTSSDYRLKEDFRPITGALDRLLLARPLNFAWRKSGERTDGFIAHELAAVVPQAVTGEKDAVQVVGVATLPDGGTIEGIPETLAPEGSTWERTGEVPAYQQVDLSKLVPLLIAAVQELAAKVSALSGSPAAA